MNRLRWVLLFIFTVLIAVQPLTAQPERTLVITTLSDISTLDPHVGYDTLSWPTSSLFYAGLIGLDENQQPVPKLAESFTVSEDGLTYTFTLREGIRFSNGREITGEDVKYSFERLLNPETASPTAYFFDMIEGADAVIAGETTELSGITVEGRTITFRMTRPEWTLLQRFALPPGFIIAREGVEAAGADFGRQPLGAGPFVLESWQSGVRLVAVANPNYYNEGFPRVDRVQIDIGIDPSVGVLRIENGEADVSLDFVPNSDYPRIASDPMLAENLIEITAFPNVQYLIPDTREGSPFASTDVRRALSMAIDRDRLVVIYNNRAVPATGLIPPTVQGDNPDLVPVYDPDMARELLAGAGYADGFSTTIVSTTDPTDVAVAQAIIEDWAAVGVTAELLPLEFAQWLDVAINRPQEMPVGFIGWFLDYQDPSNVYEPLVACTGSFNPGAYCNEEMDAFFREAKLIPPGEERWSAFAQLEAMMFEEMPNIPLVHVRNFYYTSDRVVDLQPDPALLLNFERVSVE
ncbi:MAG: ABC transporter substrate-binding protein [Anaerolinea sp.]|nr:ABC transporter substrate-binding protein [Anaerolinea sp.]